MIEPDEQEALRLALAALPRADRAPAIALALRAVRLEIAEFLRREASIEPTVRIPGHSMFLAAVKQLADRIEGGTK